MKQLKSRLRNSPLAAAANARLKSWMVEREAAATRDRYAAQAKRQGLAAPSQLQLEQALGTRIGSRARQLAWPKALGVLHVFTLFPLQNWEAVLPFALAPFGEISVFEWRSHGYDETASDWLARRDDMNRELLQSFHAANRRRPVDVVVAYASGYTVAPEALQEMAAAGAVITNFCFDDKTRWPGSLRGGRYTSPAAIAGAVDLNLTSDPDGILKYAAHGGLAMFHPEAADPVWYRPLGLPFEYDVSFVGACYGWRPRLVNGLRRHGIAVSCFGQGWPNGAVANEEMTSIYARSRINLGVGGIGYSKNLLCLKGRDFEVPMSGALYLTQHNPELSLVYDLGSEILTYHSVEDCARTIHELLGDEARAAAIRQAARTRCLRDHTYTERWKQVLRTLGALNSD